MQIYSPEQVLTHPLYKEKEVEVCIKRDDMIHPFISGNKWRKLKYNLSAVKASNLSCVVTFGGAWSNHLLATACACALHGLRSKAFVRGENVSNPVLTMCKMYGMELIFVDRESYRDKHKLYEEMLNNESYYFIDEGGSGKEASIGCAELIEELEGTFDYIFCAAGTGTTAAGLALGIEKAELQTQLHVVPVLKGGEFIRDEMVKLGAPIHQLVLHNDFHFGGYARTKPELINFVKSFVKETGIMIEPTYTGKAMYAMNTLIADGYFKPHSRILFVHTGGLTGLLGMIDKF